MNKGVRQEVRRVLPSSGVEAFLSYLKGKGFVEVHYSTLPCTQTIYFDHDFYPLPFGISFKIRRYLNHPEKEMHIDPMESYILEQKKSFFEKGVFLRKKERKVVSGREMLKQMETIDLGSVLSSQLPASDLSFISRFSGMVLKPHVVTQYNRRHFVVGEREEIRITLDSDVGFFAFEGEKASAMGEYDGVVVEFKLNDSSKQAVMEETLGGLDQQGGIPTISKKCMAFNQLAMKRGLEGVQLDVDTGYKMGIQGIDAGLIFLALRQGFEAGMDGFRVDPAHPYSLEMGVLHTYYENEKGDKFRVRRAGNLFEVEVQAESTLWEKPALTTQLGPSSSVNELKSELGDAVNEIYFMRKSFQVLREGSNPAFSVSVDNLYGDRRLQSQVVAQQVSGAQEERTENQCLALQQALGHMGAIAPYLSHLYV